MIDWEEWEHMIDEAVAARFRAKVEERIKHEVERAKLARARMDTRRRNLFLRDDLEGLGYSAELLARWATGTAPRKASGGAR